MSDSKQNQNTPSFSDSLDDFLMREAIERELREYADKPKAPEEKTRSSLDEIIADIPAVSVAPTRAPKDVPPVHKPIPTTEAVKPKAVPQKESRPTPAPVPVPAPTPAPVSTESWEALTEPAPEEKSYVPTESWETLTDISREERPVASKKGTPKKSLGRRFLEWLIPIWGEGLNEILRKCCFSMAFIMLIISLSYLINDTVLIPYSNTQTTDSVKDLYIPDEPQPLTPAEQNFDGYPKGITEDFKKLYYANNDVRGWITYGSTSDYWYTIDYPIVQTTDNDYYLHRDFYKTVNKNGTLFFDYRNDFSSPEATNKVTLIYGHNMRSGQMFATLNKLYDLGFAQSAPLVTLSTLYTKQQYKVFAVFAIDEDEPGHWSFVHTEFRDDEELQRYLDEIALRSFYIYQDVDVNLSDEFLLLSTCGNTAQNYLGNGRTVVAARKLRDGESPYVNPNSIIRNPSKLMPKAWYTKQGLDLPEYYTKRN